MLSKEQIILVRAWGVRYYIGVLRTRNISRETAVWWMQRYRASMQQVLQKQGKR